MIEFLTMLWTDRKQVLYGVIIAALVWVGVYLRGGWDHREIERIQDQAKAEIATAVSTAQQKCRANQQISTETSNAYHDSTAPIFARYLDDLGRLSAKAGDPPLPTTNTPGGTHAAARAPELPAKRGVDAFTLLTIAAKCDTQAQQLNALQTFVRHTWKANGQ